MFLFSSALSSSASLSASDSLTQSLMSFVALEASHLAVSYTCSVDELRLEKHLGLRLAGDSPFARNLDLKSKLAELWASVPERRLQIAAYRAHVWGGVPVSTPARVAAFVSTIEAGELPSFPGITSWSRIASAAHPEESATFDARVVLALNALQFLSGATDAVVFPSLPSRDTVIRRVSGLLRRTWKRRTLERLPREEVFPAYLELLRRCAQTMEGPMAFAHIEMVLVAKAEDLARQVENVLHGGHIDDAASIP